MGTKDRTRRTGPVQRRAAGVVDDLATRIAWFVVAKGSATSEQITAEFAARAGLPDDLTRARKLAEKRGAIVRGEREGHGFKWHAPAGEVRCAATAVDAGAGLTLRCVLLLPHEGILHTAEGMQWRDGEAPRGFMGVRAEGAAT